MDAQLTRRLFAVFPEKENPSLDALAKRLLERQKISWPGLAEGHAALEEARIREIRGDNWTVKVQFNPRRIVSTGARLDSEAIRRRPCFLCLSNLPPEQRAILYRETFVVLCNPAPIFPGHLTIAHCRHLPQSILENLEILLRLAADFGPGMTLFYNGPRCGASAPDHLHFQAAPAGLVPVEAEVLEPGNRVGVRRLKGVSLWRTQGLGRGILVIEGSSAASVASAFGETLAALFHLTGSASRRPRPARGVEGHNAKQIPSLPGSLAPQAESYRLSADEPMVNLLCTHTGSAWRVIVFPRRTLRPAAYYHEGEKRLLVSPGAVDMCGMVITPLEKDFLVLDRGLLEEVFREVALDDSALDSLLEVI
jgi:hypothetical protein